MTSVKKAQKRYEKERTIKKVSFNNTDEADLLEFLKTIGEFSPYVKKLLRFAMKEPGLFQDKKVERDPNTVDWVDEETANNRPSLNQVLKKALKTPVKKTNELEHYRKMLLRFYRKPEAYKNMGNIDISDLTEDIINNMSIEEIRGYIGYV